MLRSKFRNVYRRILPVPARQWLVRNFRYPYAGKMDFGDFNRTKPISPVWGLDRGNPIDRYYIENFLSTYSSKIRGHILEIGENRYTIQYGGENIRGSDILHVAAGFPGATIIADLTHAEHIPSDTFDCIICTQTLHLIFELDLAIDTLHRILKPGGVLLATVPGISQISRYDMDRWGDYWRFTNASAQRLFEKHFSSNYLDIHVYGNVLAAIAFLQGVAVRDLNTEDLEVKDPDYQVILGICAEKGEV